MTDCVHTAVFFPTRSVQIISLSNHWGCVTQADFEKHFKVVNAALYDPATGRIRLDCYSNKRDLVLGCWVDCIYFYFYIVYLIESLKQFAHN